MTVTDQLFQPASDVMSAIYTRRSMRGFKPDAVSRDTLEVLLQAAARAPSGTNTQPWKVYVLQGATRQRLCDEVCAAHDAVRANPELGKQYTEEYDYYPTEWVSPFIDRRRQNGWALYGLLDIGKGDKDAMHAQHQKNYRFFDAPVGLMFTVNKIMGRGSLLDYGMFLENLMLAARGLGLHTCPQAAWNHFSKLIMPVLGAGEDEMLVCGMALGYGDENAIVNTLETPREAAADFTTWLD